MQKYALGPAVERVNLPGKPFAELVTLTSETIWMRRMMTTRDISFADRIGVALSGLCLLHCILLPVLLGAAPQLTTFIPGDEKVHRILFVAVSSTALWALFTGYARHKQLLVPCLGACALVALSGGAFIDGLPRWCDVGLSLCGSLLMIVAHGFNHTFCARCKSCECTPQPEHRSK